MDPEVAIVLLLLSAFLAYVFQPTPPGAGPPPNLEDFDIPTVEEGKPIPVVFGDAWLRDPNVLWYGDLSVYPVQKRVGKK